MYGNLMAFAGNLADTRALHVTHENSPTYNLRHHNTLTTNKK